LFDEFGLVIIMSTAGVAGYWVADAVTAAAQAGWSRFSLHLLMDLVGDSVAATPGQIIVGRSQADWRSRAQGVGPGNHLCEFRSVEMDNDDETGDLCGPSESHESGGVEVLLEVEQPSVESEDLVDLVGNLVCAAMVIGVGVTVIQMRAELLGLLVAGESRKHQAAGLLAERFECSVSAGIRRLENTASRFQISPTGFAAQLLGMGHRGVVGPG
jgi:hypothetical protein